MKVVPSRLRKQEVEKYPIIEKECLAVVWCIRRFKLYLAGKRFTLQIDHKALKYLKDAAYQNDHGVFRWAMTVQEYFFLVEDIPGKENIGARLDILVSGQTFIPKYIFLFLWLNAF